MDHCRPPSQSEASSASSQPEVKAASSAQQETIATASSPRPEAMTITSPHPEAKPFGMRFCLRRVSTATAIAESPLPTAPATQSRMSLLSTPHAYATRNAPSDGSKSSVAIPFSAATSIPPNGQVTTPNDQVSTANDYLTAFNSMLAAIELAYPSTSIREDNWRDDEDWEEDRVFFPFP